MVYCAALIAAFNIGVQAQSILYNFNDLAGGVTSASKNELSSPPQLTLSGPDVVPAGQTGRAFTDISGTLHSAGLASAWGSGLDGIGGNSFRLNFDSTGYENFVVSYDYRSTSSGSPSATLSYRIGDEGTFIPFTTQNFTRDSAYHSTSVDLSSLSDIENVPNVALLWELGPGSGSGTFRMDNLQLAGNVVVPEPEEYGLMVGAFLVGLAVYRRRKASTATPSMGT